MSEQHGLHDLHWIDYLVIAIYSVFVLGVGAALKRYMRTSTDFFFPAAAPRRGSPAWRSFPRSWAPWN